MNKQDDRITIAPVTPEASPVMVIKIQEPPLIELACREGKVENHFVRTFRTFLDAQEYFSKVANQYFSPARVYRVSYAVNMTGDMVIFGSLMMASPESELYNSTEMDIRLHALAQAEFLLLKSNGDQERERLLKITIDMIRLANDGIKIYDADDFN